MEAMSRKRRWSERSTYVNHQAAAGTWDWALGNNVRGAPTGSFIRGAIEVAESLALGNPEDFDALMGGR
jgi:hypothetical protein